MRCPTWPGSGTVARGALACALGLYLAVGLTHLALPGLQYDEAFDPLVAVEMLEGQPLSCVRTVSVLGRPLPLMLQDHEGPTTIYTSLVGLSVLGISVEALRASQLAIGALTLVLLWILARRWFGATVEGLAVLLCATAPAFVFWSRSGANWMLPQLPIALGLALAVDRWLRTRERRAAGVAALLFGLGVTSKILFVWLAAPFVLTGVLLARRSALPPIPWGTVVSGLVVGALPLLVHNLDGAPTWRRIAENAGTTRLYGHRNLAVSRNLGEQARSFARMIGGSVDPIGAPAGLPLGGPLLAFAVVVPACVVFHRRREIGTRPDLAARLFLLLAITTVLPLSTVSLSHLGATYLFVLVPFTWLLVAVALSDAARLGTTRRHRIAVAALGLALIAHGLVGSARIHRSLEESGGRGAWSDASTALAARLESEDRPVAAMDWGFARNVAFLTRGRVRPQEFFEYRSEPSPELDGVCDALLRDPQRLYLFHADRHTAFRGVFAVLERAAARRGLALHPVAEFRERDGSPNTLLYAARPADPAAPEPTDAGEPLGPPPGGSRTAPRS